MDDDGRYNGWTNYETWGVALVLDNDEGTYTMVRERVAEIVDEAPEHHNVPEIWTAEQAARFETADWLKDFTQELCGIGDNELGIAEPSLMAQQLLGGAIGSVDWDEIAGHKVDEALEGVAARLEELRAELRAERISYGELAELESLAAWIAPGDVELLEAAGVPEHEAGS